MIVRLILSVLLAVVSGGALVFTSLAASSSLQGLGPGIAVWRDSVYLTSGAAETFFEGLPPGFDRPSVDPSTRAYLVSFELWNEEEQEQRGLSIELERDSRYLIFVNGEPLSPLAEDRFAFSLPGRTTTAIEVLSLSPVVFDGQFRDEALAVRLDGEPLAADSRDLLAQEPAGKVRGLINRLAGQDWLQAFLALSLCTTAASLFQAARSRKRKK